eukprot:CAMPEP_0172687258 /NCGR_PEP_ID=MMETSP1074-20121228/21547_1 /TAXON_ID=2916 /ORGANISM="Ceratium fusus, Strain PA161109" /LENGTH=177 /DNA_ID=CAMNT_0013506689 /DNA_START=457 /DNA_END=991 /DNA_ORIENTATION=+
MTALAGPALQLFWSRGPLMQSAGQLPPSPAAAASATVHPTTSPCHPMANRRSHSSSRFRYCPRQHQRHRRDPDLGLQLGCASLTHLRQAARAVQVAAAGVAAAAGSEWRCRIVANVTAVMAEQTGGRYGIVAFGAVVTGRKYEEDESTHHEDDASEPEKDWVDANALFFRTSHHTNA